MNEEKSRKPLTAAILSLSLLTVMAGAAIAPALNYIQEDLTTVPKVLVQLIISMPALFIALTNLVFPRLAKRYGAKTLVLIGVGLYVIFGCGAGLFRNIVLILICRALLGVGVGILMPLSTGLIAFYFRKDEQDHLMGMASAMNMLGGVVAMMLAGVLAGIHWRYSFLVYLLGLISVILCARFMPNDRIAADGGASSHCQGVFRNYYPYIVAMFLVMLSFFIYPADFALEAAKHHSIPQHWVAIVMSCGDIFGFIGGLVFARMKKMLGNGNRVSTAICFFIGYLLLVWQTNWFGCIVGSWWIGFANGIGIPWVLSGASQKAGKDATSTIMPFLSMSLYISQFTAPFITRMLESVLGIWMSDVSPFHIALLVAVLLLLWSFTIPSEKKAAN